MLQDDILAFLSDPATHGLAPGTTERRQTHISELVLAGDLVFKVKRPVHYSFVDFTSLEARRRSCEAELALNRRTAPDLYLRVAAIRQDDRGRLSLDREDGPEEGPRKAGQPVEWAVVMRRFDESLMFDRLADQGRLEEAWIDELADIAVELHLGAPPAGAPFGGAAGLRRTIDENAVDMPKLETVFAPKRTAALIEAQRAAIARLGPLLDDRRREGWVRRCHGDLHLGNIVLWQGRPTPFDCIEFSESIATIDVAYDLAFLLMDLECRGLRGLANRVMGRYFGRMGGCDITAALPLMLSLRAAIRAKVAALALVGNGDTPADSRTAFLRDRALRFFDAAQAFMEPPPSGPPRLIAVGGLSGSGKTTLAADLAPLVGRAPGALHLRSDIIRKRLAGVSPETRLPPAAYTRKASHAVYSALTADAAAALAGGQSVICDAVFAQPEERAAIAEIARKTGAVFGGLWLQADRDTLIRRVTARHGDASDATAEVVRMQAAFDTGGMDWAMIDAARPRPAGPDADDPVLADALNVLRLQRTGEPSTR